MIMAGVSDIYSKSNDLLNPLLDIDLCAGQVYRYPTLIGCSITSDLNEVIEHPALQEYRRVYTSIQTNQGWQEVEPGHIFREKRRVEANERRYKLNKSTYIGHVGLRNKYIPKFEASLGTYKKNKKKPAPVLNEILCIQQYPAKNFSESTYTLNYYHTVEHPVDFVSLKKGTQAMTNLWSESILRQFFYLALLIGIHFH